VLQLRTSSASCGWFSANEARALPNASTSVPTVSGTGSMSSANDSTCWRGVASGCSRAWCCADSTRAA
jgi:hypothetical protein